MATQQPQDPMIKKLKDMMADAKAMGIGSYAFNPNTITGNNVIYNGPFVDDPTYVIFYGFNGLLKNLYTQAVKIETLNTIADRIKLFASTNASKNTFIPYKIMTDEEFQTIRNTLPEASNFKEISFEDVMSRFRLAELTEEKEEVDEYDEPEVDEMDDNCISGCQPGNHKCGK